MGQCLSALTDMFKDAADVAEQLLPRLLPYRFAASNLPAAERQITALTYNINFAIPAVRTASSRVIQAITESTADLVFLQETNALWQTGPLRKLSERYPHQHFVQPTAERQAGGSAVLSRWPLRDFKSLDVSREVDGSVFSLVFGVVDTPLGPVHVANVHLRPPVELDGRAGFATARLTGPVRLAEVNALLEACPKLELIAGDFNEQDGAHALARLARAGLRDALAEHVPRHKETHRFSFPVSGATLHKRLDHIAYKGERLACVGCGVIPGYETGASDHQPVLARFVARGAEKLENEMVR